MIMLKFLAPLAEASRATTVLGRRTSSRSLELEGGCETIHEQTPGSRIANRHISATGKRDSTGSVVDITVVACNQASRIPTFADTFVLAVSVKRGFRYVVTTLEMVLFTWSFE